MPAEKNRMLPHAVILSSLSPEVQNRKALELAAAAVCTATDGPFPCGSCRACRKVQNGVHPDVITIERLTDSTGKPRRELVVDQIRDLSEDSVVLPNEADHKVYIIRDADLMNAQAQNAALKLLEEPPKGVIFILLVRNPGLLLDTVRSRCAELSVGGGEEEYDPDALKAVQQYLKAAAKDECEVFLTCVRLEKMDPRTAQTFFEVLKSVTADILSGREENPGIADRQLIHLGALADRCLSYLKVNVGVKHVIGLLECGTMLPAEGK